ncbi:hypothetical protein DO021_13915 [Desulfobacter hydrogenophilus]|uniref:Uncharacterized protein n=1 Tax=Desulfobacter hydrogenophilus TaxID=2291 RepID=A0A328FCK3_9BACT|nr:hypothetical protein EYB58_17120 [Desulfobacter hydrogenophilus]RAM01450.1 hypothetical protein DO021_13915 [Desulfobacter hydrogenophilus]
MGRITIDEIYVCLKELEQDSNRLVRNAYELEQMEQEILGYTKRISALLLKKIQVSVNFRDQVD